MKLKEYDKWLKTIVSLPELNGGGSELAPLFSKVLDGKKFKSAFEWCSGPSWIGMWLLEQGICNHLVAGDINPKAINCVMSSAKIHSYNVDAYVSDNLQSIPSEHCFDLVVANPPNYCNIQESHPSGHLRYDLRPSDIDWKIHREFYRTIGSYLADEATMLISEVSPRDTIVSFENQIYDLRDKPPIESFGEMISEANLTLIGTYSYQFDDTPCEILVIQKQ